MPAFPQSAITLAMLASQLASLGERPQRLCCSGGTRALSQRFLDQRASRQSATARLQGRRSRDLPPHGEHAISRIVPSPGTISAWRWRSATSCRRPVRSTASHHPRQARFCDAPLQPGGDVGPAGQAYRKRSPCTERRCGCGLPLARCTPGWPIAWPCRASSRTPKNPISMRSATRPMTGRLNEDYLALLKMANRLAAVQQDYRQKLEANPRSTAASTCWVTCYGKRRCRRRLKQSTARPSGSMRRMASLIPNWEHCSWNRRS